MRLKTSIVSDSLRELEAKKELEVPAGYIEVKLSTHGTMGAPAVLHVRNFKVGELVSLSLSSDTELPRRIISSLNDMILEDVDVANFHEREVEELMVCIYTSFYKNVLEDVIFPLNQDDLNYLAENNPQALEDIKNKRWTPRTTINIVRDVNLYEVPENYNPDITIKDKKTGFFVTFGYIKYGDRLIVKEFLDNYYQEQEMKYKNIQRQIDNGDPNIDPTLEREYTEYLTEKFEMLTEVSKLISVKNYNGLDISSMSVADKYELMSKDARIDYGMIAKLSARQNKTPIGLKPEVQMMNPITHKMCERRFSFRIPTIIQALSVSGPDRYDDGFDDEDSNNLGGSE